MSRRGSRPSRTGRGEPDAGKELLAQGRDRLRVPAQDRADEVDRGADVVADRGVDFAAECQMCTIGGAVRALIETGATSTEPTEEAHHRYVGETHDELATPCGATTRSRTPGTRPPTARVLNPLGNVPYWRTTSRIEPPDHVLS